MDLGPVENKYQKWIWIPLKEISKVSGGKRLPKGHIYSSLTTSHPYIRVTDFENMSVNIDSLKYIDEDTFKKISNYTVSKDDLYISIAGTIGKVGVIPPSLDGANLTENAAKISNIKIDKIFLCYFMNSYLCQKEIKRNTIHSNQPKLALFRIEKLFIPICPVNQQKRVVSKIEELFSKIDAGMEYLKKTQILLKQYRQSVLKYAFEGKLTEQWRKINRSSEEWSRTTLTELCDIKDIDHNMPKKVDNGVPFISPKDFIGENEINFENAKMISIEDYERLIRKCKPEVGDLIYSRIGTIGKVRKVPNKKFAISYSLCLIKLKSKLVFMDYLYYLLQSPNLVLHALKSKRSIGVPDLGLTEIRNFDIPIPPLNEQNQLIKEIDFRISIINTIEKEFYINIKYANILRQSILKQAFEGKLVSPDPNDESAVMFLERIKQEKLKDNNSNNKSYNKQTKLYNHVD